MCTCDSAGHYYSGNIHQISIFDMREFPLEIYLVTILKKWEFDRIFNQLEHDKIIKKLYKKNYYEK